MNKIEKIIIVNDGNLEERASNIATFSLAFEIERIKDIVVIEKISSKLGNDILNIKGIKQTKSKEAILKNKAEIERVIREEIRRKRKDSNFSSVEIEKDKYLNKVYLNVSKSKDAIDIKDEEKISKYILSTLLNNYKN